MTNGPTLLSALESYLKLTTTREQDITANMANVDTPGYRTRDIDFGWELQRAMTNTAGMSGSVQITPIAREVPGLMERPDGNNVSLDREGLLLSATQLQYQMGVQLIKRHFHTLLSAINGGN
jgi:flagellar basal-body rod protein FlgB